MRTATILGAALLGCCLGTSASFAVSCANGYYRAGCAGPNGAAVVRKPAAPTYRPPSAYYGAPSTYYRPPVSCANGVYRAGCAGPNGAAVVRKPY